MSPFMFFFWSISVPFVLGFLAVFLPIGNRRLLAWPSLLLAITGSLAAIGWALFFWFHPSSTGAIIFGSQQLGNGLPALNWELSIDRLATLLLLPPGGCSV